jgi:hypothetical protein
MRTNLIITFLGILSPNNKNRQHAAQDNHMLGSFNALWSLVQVQRQRAALKHA